MLWNIRKQMNEYYSALGYDLLIKGEGDQNLINIREKIYKEMDAFYSDNPNIESVLLKSHLHTLMAKYFEPKIFLYNPFFFEMGMRERESWGLSSLCPSHWMQERLGEKLEKEHPLASEIKREFSKLFLNEQGNLELCNIDSPFDYDHHTLGYTKLFSVGMDGILKEIRDKKCLTDKNDEQYAFYKAAEESVMALLTISEKFSKCAEQMLKSIKDEEQRESLELIAKTACRIPKNPPQTFYEGLCMLLFTREAIATLENIGISQLGHVDRLLGALYENDIKSGRITEAQARELVGIWMAYTDIKCDLESRDWPETSTCIQLGGCDAFGNPIYNNVTKIFIEEHHKLHLVNPKLNCRYSKESKKEYLMTIGKAVLDGHNNFVLINDDVVIKGLISSGVEECDARMYVSGGCQETMIEGFGHTEGAGIYVSAVRIFDLFLRSGNFDEFIKPIDSADSFEEFYQKFINTAKKFITRVLKGRNTRQFFNKDILPCPLFSVTQKGCVESGKDYQKGGAKYNFTTVAMVGLGTLADSLFAIKTFVYDQKRLTLEELNRVLSNNWEGSESLRNEAIALLKYGHNEREIDMFAKRVLDDLTGIVRSQKNERGGIYIPSLFVYYYFEYFSHTIRATPDGRKSGDLLSAGCGPSNIKRSNDITATLQSMKQMDFRVCGGGSAVLDVMLPMSSAMTPNLFASLIYTCALCDCPTLQPNVLSKKELIDAKKYPEKHKNLIVRISGLSAYFVTLSPHVQDEIIKRNIYE